MSIQKVDPAHEDQLIEPMSKFREVQRRFLTHYRIRCGLLEAAKQGS